MSRRSLFFIETFQGQKSTDKGQGIFKWLKNVIILKEGIRFRAENCFKRYNKMRKSIKSKNKALKCKMVIQAVPSDMTIYEKNCIMSSLLGALLEQVKLQQEVRDRWFGHYLTIIGALTALATLCLKIFENMLQKERLYLLLGLMFIFACLLGTLFYILYLCQRKNYKQTYNFLAVIQTEIFKSMQVIPSELYKENTFATKKHGADFYTLFIQSLIDSAMFAIGIAFLAISQMIQIYIVCIVAIIGFIAVLIVLQLMRYFYERR